MLCSEEVIHIPVMNMTDGFPARGVSQKTVIIHSWEVLLLHPRYEDNKGDQTCSLPLVSLQSNQLGTWRKAQWMKLMGIVSPAQHTEEPVDLFLGSRTLLNFIKSYRSLRWSESCEVLMAHYLISVPMETTNTTLRTIQETIVILWPINLRWT